LNAARRSAVPAALGPICALILGVSLSACAPEPAAPMASVTPGPGKALAVFQQDDLVCQRHAIAHAGYGGKDESATPAAMPDPDAPPPGDVVPDEPAFLQCMAARGNVVQLLAPPYALSPGPVDPYLYAFPPYGGGFVGGFGFGGFPLHRGHFVAWHHGGGHHGGSHGGGHHGGGGHR
jgi:hypothetical protein